MYVRQGPNTVDAALSVSTSFAAAGSAATSNYLDLGQAVNVTPRLELELNIPALPPLVDHAVTFKLQDSADGSTFADLPISFTLPGVASTGTAATAMRLGLASTTRQYVQIVATETAGGPSLTAFKFEWHPVFFRGV